MEDLTDLAEPLRGIPDFPADGLPVGVRADGGERTPDEEEGEIGGGRLPPVELLAGGLAAAAALRAAISFVIEAICALRVAIYERDRGGGKESERK